MINVLYSFGVPSGSTVAVVPSDVLTKSTGQVPVEVQIGGLHSAFSQLVGSWHGYLKCPSYPQPVKEKTSRADNVSRLIILRPSDF